MTPARAIPVFMYHHVSPTPGLVTVSPAIFRQHIAALARDGWKTAGLDQLAAFLSGAPLPARTCILTFDDGYLDNFVHAHPVLSEYGFKAVLFVVTGWLGDGPVRRQAITAAASHNACKQAISEGRFDEVMIRWSEAEMMSQAGTFEFHSHTHTHQRWDRSVADLVERNALLCADLQQSRAALAQRLGYASQHLCWPQGYFDANYQACASETGFKYLYTTKKKIVSRNADPASLGRIVTKEKSGDWLLNRGRLFSSPLLGNAYSFINGISVGDFLKFKQKPAGSGFPKSGS